MNAGERREKVRAAAAALREPLDQLTFLAPRETWPLRHEALDRLRRLYDARLREVATLSRPPLLAVVGGTNIGKSTIFNLLLGARIACPSGTAAGTKSVALSAPAASAEAFRSDAFLPGFDLRDWRSPEALNEAYEGAPRLYLHRREDGPALAIADTPDVDSTRRLNQLTTESLFFAADALLFVTSEQKYADEACTRYLTAAARLGKRTIVVFNRARPDLDAAQDDLLQNLLPAVGFATPPELVAVPVLTEPERTPGGDVPPAITDLRRRLALLEAAGAALVQNALTGAAKGFAVELDAVLAPLEAEVTAVQAFHSRGVELAERQAAAYRPGGDLDDLDTAVLEALEELRVPGIDWVYEQLGLVKRRLFSGLKFLGTWARQMGGRELKTFEQVADEQAAYEAEQARLRLDELLARLRDEVRQTPPEVRDAVHERLPAFGAAAGRDAAVAEYVGRVEATRKEIIADAKRRIIEQLKAEGTKIKWVKGLSRSAVVGVSVGSAVVSGGLDATDLAVAPLADAVTKWILDTKIGQEWREKLQQEITAQRRALLRAWLIETALEPVREGLPAPHQEGFIAGLREAAEQLRAAGSEGDDATA